MHKTNIVFSCNRCGACCNNIQGNFTEKEIQDIKVVFKRFENQGMYLALDPEKFSIPLFPQEAETMKKLASTLGVEFNPVPKLFMLDSRTGYCIVLEWDLGYSNCPFFEKNRCLIHKNRPLACQSFPVFPYSFSSPHLDYMLLGRCPQSRKHMGLNREQIKRVFNDEIKAVSLFCKELEKRRRMKEELMEKKLLLPMITERRNVLKILEKTGTRILSIDEFYSASIIGLTRVL
ncbi:MAG TPA: hypothetical protein ENI42_04225 [Thermoplasmatales archaeon]|nr:hypothetical protein [Thermoplasmatales archaeon]